MDKPRISIIAALGRDRGIGYRGELLWRIPQDLKRFKATTFGKPVIMGRKTFESIGRILSGRLNIVVSRNKNSIVPGATNVHSLEAAIAAAKYEHTEIFVIGGGEIYKEALPLADRLYLTLIDDLKPADTFFPAYEELFVQQPYEDDRLWNDTQYRFVVLDRK